MTSSSHIDLSHIPLFRQFSDQDRSDLTKIANPKSLLKEEFLAMQGQIWPYLVLIRSGVLKTHKVSPQGRSLGVLRLADGALFISPSFIDGDPLPATLEADTDCSLLLWHVDQIRPYLDKNTQALWELASLLAKRIRQASEMVEGLAFQPVTSRVAGLLLKQHQQSGDDHISRDLTLDEMAAMVGSTPVMVCKVLSQFADQGFLKVSRTEIEFIDSKELEKLIDQP
jgi:CRP-like cAMP-binding protein